MAYRTTEVNTYNLTTGLYLDMEPLIHLLSPHDVPLTGGYGADGRTVLTTGVCFEKKVEWLDETLLTPRSALSGALTTGTTAVAITTGDGAKFGAGDLLRLANGEVVRVASRSTDTLTVVRAIVGTATNVADASAVIGVGTALTEGSDPQAAKFVDRSARYNVTEIFGPYGVRASMSEQAVRKYGISDAGTTEFEHQASNRLKEGAVAIEQAVVYGKLLEDTSEGWRAMNGILNHISTNHDSTTNAISEATLLAQMQAAYEAGGNPDRLVVGPKTKRVISAWATGLTINTMRPDNGRGQTVDYFDCDFGRVSVILDRWVATADAFGFNRDQAELCTLRPFQFEPLAKTGDRIEGQIVGEKTLKFRRERHAFKFSALT
jgi:hypothetical protein